MKNKILVTVLVPMIDQKYDIYIPISKNIKVTIDLISKAISELSNGAFPLKDKYTLISSTGQTYDYKSTVKESKIKNGDKLVLL